MSDTLTIRFYQTSDSNTVVTSTSIFNASPGHAYNLLLRGYRNYQSYTDPFTGKLLNVNADLKAVVTQNCSACHSGMVEGQLIPGLANKWYDQKAIINYKT